MAYAGESPFSGACPYSPVGLSGRMSDEPDSKPAPAPAKSDPKDERARRLAQALRDNLRRRKAGKAKE
jgi:hypothetical protein